jgi:putative hydrolase of the HAD superfamily
MTRLALFDLDDTLFDHTGTAAATLAAWRAEVPALADVPFDRLRAVYHEALEATHAELIRGRLTVAESRTRRMGRVFAACGAPVDDPQAAAAGQRFRELYQGLRRPVSGARELLAAVRAHARVAIVSNNLHAEQWDKLRHLGCADLIDALVTSEETGYVKPDPRIFAAALAAGDATPAQAVMLGDAWEIDIVGAQAAGIRPVWLNRAGQPCPAPGAVAEIRALEPTADVARLLLEGQ